MVPRPSPEIAPQKDAARPDTSRPLDGTGWLDRLPLWAALIAVALLCCAVAAIPFLL